MGYMPVTYGPWLSNQSQIIIYFNIIIKNMKHFLGSVEVRGFVRGPFFTRLLASVHNFRVLLIFCDFILFVS